jgi:hypothetical protein
VDRREDERGRAFDVSSSFSTGSHEMTGYTILVRTSESTRGGMAVVEKRARSPTGDNEGALIETKKSKSDALSVSAVPRTSTLHSPIMVLTGHGGEVRRIPALLADGGREAPRSEDVGTGLEALHLPSTMMCA